MEDISRLFSARHQAYIYIFYKHFLYHTPFHVKFYVFRALDLGITSSISEITFPVIVGDFDGRDA
jgi:hypothetical protein